MSDLILVTGPPASGKTTLAEHLGHELSIPTIHKDGVKESLFDTLGAGDSDMAKRLGLASIELLYHLIERHLTAKAPLIVENNFQKQWAADRVGQLREDYRCRILEVYCTADANVLAERYRTREDSPDRHDGHRWGADPANADSWAAIYPPLGTVDATIRVDTTNIEAVSYEDITREVRRWLEGLTG